MHLLRPLTLVLVLAPLTVVGCGGSGTGTDSGVDSATGTDSGSDASTGTDGGLAAGECRGDGDCDAMLGEGCVRIDDPQTCGICFDPMNVCMVDGDCAAVGAGLICETFACACDPGALDCVPGCTGPADCREGQECGMDGRCAARTCAVPGDCPETEIDCSPGGTCERRGCTGDAECNGGFCVRGACFDAPGICMPPAA